MHAFAHTIMHELANRAAPERRPGGTAREASRPSGARVSRLDRMRSGRTTKDELTLIVPERRRVDSGEATDAWQRSARDGPIPVDISPISADSGPPKWHLSSCGPALTIQRTQFTMGLFGGRV